MAYENDILTRNDDDELSVRVVQSTGDNPAVAYDDVYTRDDNGKLAVRVVGGGGGSVDYNRVVEKIDAIPSATSSTVGKVYMYMGETNSTYTHGYIYECVATQTATAVAFSGSIITSWAVADFVSYMQEGGSAYDEVTHGTLTYDASGGLWDLVGYDANGVEVLSFHEYTEDLEDFGCVFASETHQDGDSCQFTLTTEQSGEKWKRLDVQPNNGGGGGGSDPHNLGWYATESALTTAHPTANDGDWAIVGSTDTVWVWDSDTTAWKDTDQKGQVVSVNGQTGVITLGINDVAPTQTGKSGYVLGTDGFVAGWVKPEIVQVSALPAASEDEVDNIYQFVGTTDANYTNGYFYKCVSDGQDPATYSWTQTDVQPQASGLPDQTGQSGKFLTTDGSSASWSGDISLGIRNNTLVGNGINNNGQWNTIIGQGAASPYAGCYYGVAVGYQAKLDGFNNASIAIGSSATVGAIGNTTNYGIAIGYNAKVSANYAIQLGYNQTNSDANTFKVANSNGNFELMSADGTIPTDRFTTTPVADGTYVPTLTISSGVATRSWGAAASAPVVPATMPTLAVADWSSNTQTVNVTGVTASNIVFVSPAPASAADYAAAGIVCTAQGSGTLTFTCDTVPSGDIDVNVVML